jgi:hypothetical protein
MFEVSYEKIGGGTSFLRAKAKWKKKKVKKEESGSMVGRSRGIVHRQSLSTGLKERGYFFHFAALSVVVSDYMFLG